MRPKDQPGEELDLAIRAYAAMRHADSLAEVEMHWKTYLQRLERIWNKLQALYKDHPQWHRWSGSITTKRREDPLLAYLVNARGAEEHTVASVSARHTGATAIVLQPGQTLHIEKLIVDDHGIQFEGIGDLHVEFIPEHVIPLPVVNRGRTYQPPKSHLGEELGEPCVLLLAHCGIDYYVRVVDDAESFFTSDPGG